MVARLLRQDEPFVCVECGECNVSYERAIRLAILRESIVCVSCAVLDASVESTFSFKE